MAAPPADPLRLSYLSAVRRRCEERNISRVGECSMRMTLRMPFGTQADKYKLECPGRIEIALENTFAAPGCRWKSRPGKAGLHHIFISVPFRKPPVVIDHFNPGIAVHDPEILGIILL